STGMTHVFFVESVMRRTLLELADLGVTPILAHSEKAAAYMADGYARIMRRPGVCMAQSVGAANLASGLQDPYLGRSPVIALTGRKEPSFQHRNAYQEIAHAPLFAAVTKFSTPVDSTSELPRLLRPALAEALAAPIATTLGARGIIPTRHRLSVGVAGSYSAPPANRVVHGADLVLFVGCDTGDQVTLNWTVPSPDTKIVQIDADPLEI